MLGIVLGVLLFLTSKGQLWQNRAVYSLISVLVNVFRSIPFIILIVLLIPFTKSLIGTILGADAALPALIVGAAPFYARLVEIALREVDKGVIEAARSMGAKNRTLIFRVLLPESSPALVSGITVTPDRAGELHRDGRGDRRRWPGQPGLSGRVPTQPQ